MPTGRRRRSAPADPEQARIIAEAKRRKFVKLTVALKYRKSLKNLLAAGRYDTVDPRITEEVLGWPNWRCKFEEEVDYYLLRTSDYGALIWHRAQLRTREGMVHVVGNAASYSAGLDQLLAFGAAFPEVQRALPILTECYVNVPQSEGLPKQEIGWFQLSCDRAGQREVALLTFDRVLHEPLKQFWKPCLPIWKPEQRVLVAASKPSIGT